MATLLFAFWLIVHWGLLPRVAQWKPWIEARASQALGQSVRIEALRVTSHGWIPALEMNDVRVLDGQGRTALQMGRVQATVAAHALLAMELRFAQLHVDGVQLDVRRDLNGRIRVAGMDTEADANLSDEGQAADWLFAQQEIAIRRGTVRWTDEKRGAPPLELADVDLVLRNGLIKHQLRVDATPPAAWGQRLTLIGDYSQPWLERRGNFRAWSGTLHADLPAVDVGELRRYVNLPFDLRAGRGAVRAWLETEAGEWHGATADVALSEVLVRLAKHLEPLSVSQLSGHIKASRRDDGVDITASKVALTTGDGQAWPLGSASLNWSQTQARSATESAGPVTGGRLRADHLDLGVMANLASRLPLGRAVEGQLRRLKPAGIVQGLDLRWTGAPDEPQRWNAKGRLTGFVLPPAPADLKEAAGRPGVSGADLDFDFNEAGGHADLAIRDGELHFPGIFESPKLAMGELQAKLDWKVKRRPQIGAKPDIELRVSQARFANADMQGNLQATWRTGRSATPFGAGGYLPGEIDVTGQIQQAKANRVAAYLPLGIPAPARRYVGRAVKGGQLENAIFAIQGDVWHFPFNKGQPGTFHLAGRLRDVQFDYLPTVAAGEVEPAWVSPWPGFSQVSGELVFDRSAMSLSRAQAQLLGVQLRDVQASVDEWSPNPVLRAKAEARGPLADVLKFVDTTPIGQWLSGAMRPMTAQGSAELKLELGIPILQPQQSIVKGSVNLGGNDVQIRPDLPLLAAARGRIDFTQEGFQINQGTARALGGELSVDGGTQADRSLRFVAQGIATADGLQRAKEFAPLPSVAKGLRGQAQWNAQLAFVKGLPEVTVRTDLVGMQSDWPAPLNKPAALALPVVWKAGPIDDRSRLQHEPPRDEIRLDLGSLAQLRLLREWPAATELPAAGARVLGGSVGLSQAAAPPQPGGIVSVRGHLQRLDANAWSRALDRLASGDGQSAWPRLQLAVQVDELLAAQRLFTHVVIDALQEPVTGGTWHGEVVADQLAGKVSWRPAQGVADAGRWTARLAHFTLPPTQRVGDELWNEADQQRWPAVDAQIEELTMRGRKMGRLELQATARGGAATARDWSLERLQLDVPGGHLIGEGHWTAPAHADTQGRMAMNLSLNVQDSALMAQHFGWVDAVKGGNGLIQGQLSWSGAPGGPDFPSMEGQLHVALNQGQFLRAEPGGIGRLLGILSLQSLPRRLLFDFRDVFQQGFAFDQVTGDIQIVRGRAKTDNLRMRGLQATVFVDGQADLLKETQDLRVLIVPEVNAGAASLAYVVVNPAVGLGTFLAQLLLRDPLRVANTREFVVTGPMADPKVERIERSASAPLPPPQSTDAPAERSKSE